MDPNVREVVRLYLGTRSRNGVFVSESLFVFSQRPASQIMGYDSS